MYLSHASIGLAAALSFGMVLLQEIGFRIGRAAKASDASRAGTSLIEAAVFTLLSLLLAFEFAQAGSRLDYQRGLTVREANAISAAYLRLSLLAADRQPALRDRFRRYAEARIRVWEKLPEQKAAKAEAAVARKLQAEIWSRAVSASLQEPTPAPTMLLISAIDEMIDVTTARKVAAQSHTPALIVFLLFGVALLSALLAGYAMSAANRRSRLHALVFAGVIAITVFVILDLEYLHTGVTRIAAADRAMVEARQAMD